MANKKTLQRKKPGYTRNGEVKIVSLSHKQLTELVEKTSKKKTVAKIRNRIRILEDSKGFVKAVEVPAEEAAVVESLL